MDDMKERELIKKVIYRWQVVSHEVSDQFNLWFNVDMMDHTDELIDGRW
jgi:hypothetical protein